MALDLIKYENEKEKRNGEELVVSQENEEKYWPLKF